MRNLLAERTGQRLVYIARLKVYGVRHPIGGPRKRRGTALMKPVWSESRELLADHVWIQRAEPFVLAGVGHGQWVQFSAIAVLYAKGHADIQRHTDYTLEDAADIEILG